MGEVIRRINRICHLLTFLHVINPRNRGHKYRIYEISTSLNSYFRILKNRRHSDFSDVLEAVEVKSNVSYKRDKSLNEESWRFKNK